MILSLLFYLSTNTGKDLGRKFYESSDTNPAVFASLCVIVVPVLIFIIMKKFLRKRTRNTTRPPRLAEPQLGEQITTGKLLLCILSEFCDVTNCSLTVQSVENCRKECHRSWLPLTSHSDSNFERSNISFKENTQDGVDPNSNAFYYCVRKKEGRTLRLSAD